MAHLIRNSLLACGLALAATSLCVPSALAAEAKKPLKAKAKGKAKAKPVVTEHDAIKPTTPEDEPDVTDKNSVDFNCELGNKVTVYSHETDDSHIALRWKKRLHRLSRVGTTTGAQRFENTNFGLIWIGIPAKGMLLDSKLNRQLANECKNAEQENPIMAAPAKPDLIAPVGKAVVEPAIPPAALAQPVLPGAASPVDTQAPAMTPVTPVTPVPPALPAPQETPVTPATPAAAMPAPPIPSTMTPSMSPSVTPGVALPSRSVRPAVPAADPAPAPAAPTTEVAPAPTVPAVKN